MEDFYDYQNNDINQFLKNYRDALGVQRDSTWKQLGQQRRNDYATIMSGANKRGMSYSNFPQRAKTQYMTSTYMPAYNKAQASYQSALDSLRSNAVNLWNKIKSYNEQIADLDNDII